MIAALAITGVLLAGCNDDKAITSTNAVALSEQDEAATESTANVELDSSQDQTVDEGVMVQSCSGKWIEVVEAAGSVYGDASMDSSAAEYLEKTCLIQCVQDNIERMAAEGYEIRLDLSVLISGAGIPEGTNDTIDVTIAEIAMVHKDWDSNGLEAYIRHTRYEPGTTDVVQTSVITFKDPEDAAFDLTYLGEGDGEAIRVWSVDYDLCLKHRSQPLAELWLSEYAKCWLKRTTVGCLTSAVICAYAGPGYLACVALGCTASAVAAAIGCALD